MDARPQFQQSLRPVGRHAPSSVHVVSLVEATPHGPFLVPPRFPPPDVRSSRPDLRVPGSRERVRRYARMPCSRFHRWALV